MLAPLFVVIRCPKLDRVANGYYICHPSTGYVLSTFCRFGCYEGFELEGASHVTCTEQKMWSSYPPKCKRKSCVCERERLVKEKCYNVIERCERYTIFQLYNVSKRPFIYCDFAS